MSYRKQINPLEPSSAAGVLYMNKTAQLCKIVSPRNLYIEAGRGSSKTTDILTERLIDMVYDIPGAPLAWVSDTFTNLTQNVIPTVLESLERKGFIEGIHFLVEKEPPSVSSADAADLPEWLRPHFWKPCNKIVSWKRKIIFFSGLNLTFGSLDRPSTLAGRSFVHIIGDEGKYFKESRLATMMKAVRGYPEYSGSPYYMGVTFTSDVADPGNIGEYDWMRKYATVMNIESILTLIKTGLVFHETMREYLAFKAEYMDTGDTVALDKCRKALSVANRWRRRWITLRSLDENRYFYLRVSSYVNVDILTADWFSNAISGGAPDLKTAVLSMRASLSLGSRFYAALSEDNFYRDGKNEKEAERFGLRDAEDCRVLKYLDMSAPLILGVDFGNMCSMVVGQDGKQGGRSCRRALKFIYTLAPEYIQALAEKFKTYFAPMKRKIIYLYYDRAANAYTKVGKSQIGELKSALETDSATGRRNGWVVHLMSVGQKTLYQAEEYSFFLKVMPGNNPKFPLCLIDFSECKSLRLSLQGARTKVKDNVVYKDKSSERLPLDELPTRSTNPSDAFKYFWMTKEIMALVKSKSDASAMNLDPTTF